MSLYAEYIKEREGSDIIESSAGFVTYNLMEGNQICYIADIFIKPEYRQLNLATEMINIVIEKVKPLGCIKLVGNVDPKANGSTLSRKFILGFGAKYFDTVSTPIEVYVKEIT